VSSKQLLRGDGQRLADPASCLLPTASCLLLRWSYMAGTDILEWRRLARREYGRFPLGNRLRDL
jgi:hypothetical protein